MLAEASVIGFVPVSDMAVAEDFYHGLLGLPVVERGPYALVVGAADGVRIRCAMTPGAKAQSFTILGWEVADIAELVGELRQAKIEPMIYPQFEQDEDGVWTAPSGDRVVWFQDPFGNVLSISQHAAAAKAANG